MSIYIQLLFLTCIVVYVVDLSGWTDTLLRLASRFTARYGYGPVRSLRPFTCSLCSTWWAGIAYALITGHLTLPVIAYIAGLSFYSITLHETFIFIREAVLKCLRKLSTKWLED